MTVGGHFDYLSDFAKKEAPHEFIVNTNEMYGRAPGKTSKHCYKIEENRRATHLEKTCMFPTTLCWWVLVFNTAAVVAPLLLSHPPLLHLQPRALSPPLSAHHFQSSSFNPPRSVIHFQSTTFSPDFEFIHFQASTFAYCTTLLALHTYSILAHGKLQSRLPNCILEA